MNIKEVPSKVIKMEGARTEDDYPCLAKGKLSGDVLLLLDGSTAVVLVNKISSGGPRLMSKRVAIFNDKEHYRPYAGSVVIG